MKNIPVRLALHRTQSLVSCCMLMIPAAHILWDSKVYVYDTQENMMNFFLHMDKKIFQLNIGDGLQFFS